MSTPAEGAADARNMATVSGVKSGVAASMVNAAEDIGRPTPPNAVISQTGEMVEIKQIEQLVIGEGDISPLVEHDGAHYDVRAILDNEEDGKIVELRRNLTLIDAQNYCAAFVMPGIDFIWSNNGMTYFSPRFAGNNRGLFQPNFVHQ